MPNLLGKIASWLDRRPQPTPLDAPARVEAILTAPEAAMFTDLAADLVRGPATSDQAIKVLARAENDAAKRAALLKSSPLESANAPTIH
jgi:hypothetical protein